MKVKVLKTFRDIHTRELYSAGSVIEVSKDRYKEILTRGEYVAEVKEAKKETSKKTETKKKKSEKE